MLGSEFSIRRKRRERPVIRQYMITTGLGFDICLHFELKRAEMPSDQALFLQADLIRDAFRKLRYQSIRFPNPKDAGFKIEQSFSRRPFANPDYTFKIYDINGWNKWLHDELGYIAPIEHSLPTPNQLNIFLQKDEVI